MPDAKVLELKELYEEADRFAREVGEFQSEVPIPAHNELRYAGHHLLQAINDDGTIADDGQILKAKNHCERAMYEAAEAGIISALDLMHIFRTDNKGVVVGEVVPGYSQMRKLARTAQDLLVKGRSGRISAVQQVRSYMDVFRALRDALDTLEAAQDDLNAKKILQIKAARRFLITCLIAVLSIAVSIALSVCR